MLSEDIRVNLDSSSPCWNDVIEEPLLEMIEVTSAGDFKITNFNFVSFVLNR